MTNKTDFYRWGLLIFSGLYIIFFAGAFFGYGPMILLLQQDGAFLSKCEDTSSSCPDQKSALLNVHFVAMLSQILSPLVGHICDKYGPLLMMVFTSSVAWMGVIVLIISRTVKEDWFLYPAFSLLNITSNSSSVMIMITGRYFAMKSTNIDKTHDQGPSTLSVSISDKKRRRAIGLLNNFFDAGSITYLILWEIKKAWPKISLQMLAVGYLLWGVFIFGGALFFWRLLLVNMKDSSIAQEQMSSSVSSSSQQDPKEDNKEDWNELRSPAFLWLCVFFAFHCVRNQFMMTSAEAFLKDLGDDDNKYIEIFTYILSISIIGLPVVDIILTKFGYHAGLQSINILAAVHGIIQISSDNPNIQIIGFVIFSFYRCFIFSIVFPFLGTLLQPQVMGKANGLMNISVGILGILNIPLGDAAIKYWGGRFFIPNLIYAVTIIPFFYAAWRCAAGIRDTDGDNYHTEDDKVASENKELGINCVDPWQENPATTISDPHKV